MNSPALTFLCSVTENGVALELSEPVCLLGFQLTPLSSAPAVFTVDCYAGNTLVKSFTQMVPGNGGFCSAAGEGTTISRVVITSDSDFTISQIRYQLAVPFPTTVLSAIAVLLAMVNAALILL